jgi:hypothetical protein
MFYPINNLATCLFPGKVTEVIKIEKFEDKQLLGMLQLALRVAIEASQAWLDARLRQIEGNFPKLSYTGFDPNPGDGGCQKRGYLHLPSLWK